MTTTIDPTNDKVLNIYNQYYDILLLRYSDSAKERSLDHLASTLTLSHFMDHIVCTLKDLNKTITPNVSARPPDKPIPIDFSAPK
jgi:hypothetical protein